MATDYVFVALPKDFVEEMSALSGNAVKVYCLLLSYSNKNEGNKAWPSNAEIMEKTGIKSRKTLSDSILELVQLGWIGDITNPQSFSHQSQYYVNTSRKLNEKLFVKRLNKRESMSTKFKAIKANRDKKVDYATELLTMWEDDAESQNAGREYLSERTGEELETLYEKYLKQ